MNFIIWLMGRFLKYIRKNPELLLWLCLSPIIFGIWSWLTWGKAEIWRIILLGATLSLGISYILTGIILGIFYIWQKIRELYREYEKTQ